MAKSSLHDVTADEASQWSRFLGILASIGGVDPASIQPGSSLRSIQLDSLQMLELLVAIGFMDEEIEAVSLRSVTPSELFEIVRRSSIEFSERPREYYVGSIVRLRPILESDYSWLFNLVTSSSAICRWRYRGVSPPPERFPELLEAGVLVQFIVEDCWSRPIGLVSAYDYRATHCSVAAISSPAYESSGLVIDGLVTLMRFVFRNWDIRHILVEGLDVNLDQMPSIGELLGQPVAVLREHSYVDGAYADLRIYALTRGRFADLQGRFIG